MGRSALMGGQFPGLGTEPVIRGMCEDKLRLLWAYEPDAMIWAWRTAGITAASTAVRALQHLL